MDNLDGATAFITGGGSGIGLAIGRALAERGAKVALADVREDHLAAARATAAEDGWADRCHTVLLDVTDRAAYAAALDEAEARLGPLRILVNNAGVGIDGPMDEASFADWDWAVSVNLGGVVNGVVLGMPRIKAHGRGGHIVNTASIAPLVPARFGRGVYATTKGAIVALSEHLRLELGDKNIGVSVVCPGPVKTNIHESGRTRPAHLREGSSFLAHEAELEKRENLAEWLEAIDVGRMTVDAILGNRLYVFPHPDFLTAIHRRHEEMEAAMR